MTIRKAQITFKGEVAGTLEETAAGGTRFIYDADWREPIACALPILRREHEWRQGVHPFFQHLGPEGWLRERQARVAHVAEEDDFGLLLRYGADCIGAVGIRPFEGATVPEDPITELDVNPGRTVSGIQRKMLVIKQGTAFVPAALTGPAPYIAKFNSERETTEQLIRNEGLSLRWSAAVLGEEEVNSFVFGKVEGEPALIVTRFDRGPDGEKRRLEDFAQILNKPRGNDFTGKYDAGYEDVARAVEEHSARPAIDLARLFRRIVLFVLIGNCDGHLKNFSLLETASGLRLSPAYDIVNTALYDGFDQTLALRLGGQRMQLSRLTRGDLVAFAARIGLGARATQQILEDLERRVTRAAPLLQPPGGEQPGEFFHRYQEIVNNACLRIFET
ncbi:MAG: HipA domain-containing protein [Proteobacteria bacterium]|nr:HipA domain-containing protein [Pseudomonadota bacterium]